MAPTQAATGPGEHFQALMILVNKLQAVCALMGDNAESAEDGTGMPGLWDTLPIIVAIGGQVCAERRCLRGSTRSGGPSPPPTRAPPRPPLAFLTSRRRPVCGQVERD